MKKTALIFTAITILLISVLPITASAANATASLTGPGTVRAGDTVTVSFKLGGNGIFGVSGALSYDGNQLTLSGTAQKIASPWAVEFNGNNFVAYDNNLSNPINGESVIFTATFKVKNIAAGTALNISCTGVTASDGTADTSIGTVTYSKTVAEPLSSDNMLSKLTVANADISPAFSPKTVNYTASVPFDVSKLDISAAAQDSKANVSLNNPTLTPNATTNVTVTVTAENGAKRVYTVSVKRAQDPNYKASDNSELSDIKVEGFVLSPVFKAEIKNYVVWLPFETESIKVSGTPSDNKASVEVVGGDNLEAGADNTVTVVCTAENGEKTEYTVIAKRAAAHGEAAVGTGTDTEDNSDNAVLDKSPPDEKKGGISPLWLAAGCVLSFAAGAAVMLIVSGRRPKINRTETDAPSFFEAED